MRITLYKQGKVVGPSCVLMIAEREKHSRIPVYKQGTGESCSCLLFAEHDGWMSPTPTGSTCCHEHGLDQIDCAVHRVSTPKQEGHGGRHPWGTYGASFIDDLW